MGDFFTMLERAVRDLPEQTAEARLAIYDRAASAMARLEGIDDTELAGFLREIDDAAARIEAQFRERRDIAIVDPGEAALLRLERFLEETPAESEPGPDAG